MKRKSKVAVLCAGFFLPTLVACNAQVQMDLSKLSSLTAPKETNVVTVPATSAQCPHGGVVVKSFTDLNFDGVLDEGEPVLSSTPICNGSDGTNGMSMVFTTVPATPAQCQYGGNVLLMALDALGTGIYSSSDPNQQSAKICNGAPGANGEPGAPGSASKFSVVHPIAPCGEASSPWKEVLLCLADGSILATFSSAMDGNQTRLSFIPAGSYIDTDQSGCHFSVANDGLGGHTVSWAAGSNQYSTWSAESYTCRNQFQIVLN